MSVVLNGSYNSVMVSLSNHPERRPLGRMSRGAQ